MVTYNSLLGLDPTHHFFGPILKVIPKEAM